jgi:non-lysosomal glucosylceramidase
LSLAWRFTHNFLFPALARSLRESAFGYCTDAQSAMGFRQLLPDDKQQYGISAADGQMGQIMKLYLDWKISDDNGWLRRVWPSAKRALEFAWVPGGWGFLLRIGTLDGDLRRWGAPLTNI